MPGGRIRNPVDRNLSEDETIRPHLRYRTLGRSAFRPARRIPSIPCPERTMKKLALHLDDLTVTSFETSPTPADRGTIHGNGGTHGNSCPATCPFSCAGTCDISCDPSCISTCPMAPCATFEETCFC
jgi:hypothetical protein